eukprot:353417-Chlamydomonas_euryale.AAC.1
MPPPLPPSHTHIHTYALAGRFHTPSQRELRVRRAHRLRSGRRLDTPTVALRVLARVGLCAAHVGFTANFAVAAHEQRRCGSWRVRGAALAIGTAAANPF